METKMADSDDDWIKQRAYELWEAEGHPTGKDTEHWERARQEHASLKTKTDTGAKSGRKSTKAEAGAPAAKPAATTGKAAASKVTTAKTSSAAAKPAEATETAAKKRTRKTAAAS
jgi:hypothetical protein